MWVKLLLPWVILLLPSPHNLRSETLIAHKTESEGWRALSVSLSLLSPFPHALLTHSLARRITNTLSSTHLRTRFPSHSLSSTHFLFLSHSLLAFSVSFTSMRELTHLLKRHDSFMTRFHCSHRAAPTNHPFRNECNTANQWFCDAHHTVQTGEEGVRWGKQKDYGCFDIYRHTYILYIYIYTIYIYIYIHVHIHLYTNICFVHSIYTFVCIYNIMYVHIHIYIYIYMCLYIYIFYILHTYTHIQTYVCMHTYIYMTSMHISARC